MRAVLPEAIAFVVAATPTVAQQPVPVDAERVSAVSPALERYALEALSGREWADDALSERDRALVTIAALIARHQPDGLGGYIRTALDSGVAAAEISETITHLAFYAGWQNAMAAVDAAAPVFAEREIASGDLPAAEPEEMLPLDKEAEAARQKHVQATYGAVSQGVVDNTEALLFRDLWRRPGLAPRDRSLVTVSALIAAGHVAQIPFHLNRAMDNGLTRDEASATLSHLAFYAGWPNVFSAMPVARKVVAQRDDHDG